MYTGLEYASHGRDYVDGSFSVDPDALEEFIQRGVQILMAPPEVDHPGSREVLFALLSEETARPETLKTIPRFLHFKNRERESRWKADVISDCLEDWMTVKIVGVIEHDKDMRDNVPVLTEDGERRDTISREEWQNMWVE